MFTGIIEATGIVKKIRKEGNNIHFTLSCPFTQELKIDQSLAHNGCCLTVVDINENLYTVTAINETLEKTNLSQWQEGSIINLERCTIINGRLDGHIVQGHVDGVGAIESIEETNGSHIITISYISDFVTVPQGSITINGISLTVAKSMDKKFSVAIIPYTWEHTNLKHIKIGDLVNLEFDIIGKYVAKLMTIK
ncbi:riboflavin synthase [Riemerella anatipestifer]|uniref:Riboflavin synthase n=2 Tax=Riemerella anatipestifer TaxID=34085 RepID=J9QYE4_RIEAN|nr:riboflavin synthase [Riemerella anatipestifer]ADQ82165.1 riboflavin synthase, alpha subunit [Riemerella anatipestifer ATCC 11845 = DSM 15868]ADZ12334.1 Riboflavin synthase alpha chain [Riemerella anatipestifer RA-GD]AFD56165.1 riboflavin synthase, alpha subunit [Riemerella anatipestifer ATCC 11845 = DSM 15868]AFR35485.1 Riboflavin synthase alpha chain [Riemerella anatipestifer RA-CH-1]AGC39914.1 Riboflavin synthase alpha chain [Riemerella anatipestifer RA-CH-2]